MNGKEKIAFVCQRYGFEVNGGSELHCRQLSEQMARFFEVHVYTTCAIDYVTWKNEYESGTEQINGITVHRFKVKKTRDPKVFGQISEAVLTNPNHSDSDEEKWIDEQGPYCPELLEVLYREQSQYKTIFFMTYLYYLTARGLPMQFDNAYLIPTVHDEAPAYLRYYDKVFNAAKGFAWNMETERRFAEKRFPSIVGKPGVIAGVGIELPDRELPEIPGELQQTPFLLYAGRIDVNKGCGEMFEYFLKYKEKNKSPLKLVLIGKPVMDIPKSDDIIQLGFVSEEMKFALMGAAKALLLFSRFESLSMVVLESMMMGRPVLVTGHCEVLKDHCTLSNAGFYFYSYGEFEAELNYLFTHESVYNAMCSNGKAYVHENYQWDRITERIINMISRQNI